MNETIVNFQTRAKKTTEQTTSTVKRAAKRVKQSWDNSPRLQHNVNTFVESAAIGGGIMVGMVGAIVALNWLMED